MFLKRLFLLAEALIARVMAERKPSRWVPPSRVFTLLTYVYRVSA